MSTPDVLNSSIGEPHQDPSTHPPDAGANGNSQSILATLREPCVVLDEHLRVQTANASFYRSFEVSREETEGRCLHELGNGQWDIPPLRTLLEGVLSNDHSFDDFEVDQEFPVIGRRTMLLNARRIVSAETAPRRILLVIEDVTENRRAAAALQTSEVRYRRLFETAKDGILILDANTGRIIDANPFMTDLLGYSRDEFLGQELWQIGLFSDKARNETAFHDLQVHGYVRYDHLPLKTKGGGETEVEFVSNVYFVAHRKVAQCNIRDISDRVRLERQAQEQARELANLHRRKDEFLAMLSHELRNPLAPIVNAVQLLRLQKGNENLVQQQARAIIARQVEQLRHLVDDLLEVSRITTGKVRLRLERIGVREFVDGAVETARPLINQRKHRLMVWLPREPIWLDGDATRLEQVVTNLLINAAKFTDEGGRIWLTVQRDGGTCVVRVRDTGIGIASELLPRIFDLFTQAEQFLDRSQGGFGVGLSLVQRLTELHGGTVEALSALGKGSEFIVRLPIAPTSELDDSASATSGAEPATPYFRVLVVDDHVDMAESFAMLVKAEGHDVRTVHDGATALRLATEFRPHAVFLDIGLPGLHGYDVAKRLRQLSGLENVLLVAVTGYGGESDRQRSREAGFDHHLLKPPDFATLRSILATASEHPT